MTCGRSFGVVILIQRASSPPLMPTRSRSGLAVCCGAAAISLVDGSAAKVFRSAMPRMIAACAFGLFALAASSKADLLSSRPYVDRRFLRLRR